MAISDRGFASMDPEKHREICKKAGVASHTKKKAHEWTSEQAAEAGRKGGLARAANKLKRQQAEKV